MTNPTFLLIEDDEIDKERFHRKLSRRGMTNTVVAAGDGGEALELLRGGEVDAQTIIFLDLNMAGVNGHDFLKELRADEDWRRSLVFVLTTSEHHRDIAKAYDFNVAGYYTKMQIDELLDVIEKYSASVSYPPQGVVDDLD